MFCRDHHLVGKNRFCILRAFKYLVGSRAVIDFVADNFPGDDILFSLMAQYTPMPDTERFPELRKTVTAEENDMLIEYMMQRGIYNGFWQEPCSATDDMIPDFDLTGV